MEAPTAHGHLGDMGVLPDKYIRVRPLLWFPQDTPPPLETGANVRLFGQKKLGQGAGHRQGPYFTQVTLTQAPSWGAATNFGITG